MLQYTRRTRLWFQPWPWERSQLPALLPAGVLQVVVNQVYDAGLQRRGQKEPIRNSMCEGMS